MGMPAAPPPPDSVPPPYTPATVPPGNVPNPAYRELFQRYSAAYGSIDQMREALNPAVRTFNATDAWLGPEARTWGDGLLKSQKDIRKAADSILWGIYEKLTSTERSLPTG
ncbi:hypothetical protein GCM10010439_50480 [Actinocorallia aurantiaca]|uniref:Type VII secretion system (Wss) protein ESAT-6 n=1 Tax=Actinocorallia aurantiaca TaxID=46204 RepID=A0ABN3UGS0_9ACTN